MKDFGIEGYLIGWLVGSVTIGGLIGCLISGKLADTIGRKKSINVSLTLNTIGWFVVTLSFRSEVVFLGRIVHGLGEGMIVSISTIYLGEIMDEKNRGRAIASRCVSIVFGIALAYILGTFLTWRTCGGVITFFCLASLLVSVVMKESPVWSKFKIKTKIRTEKFLPFHYSTITLQESSTHQAYEESSTPSATEDTKIFQAVEESSNQLSSSSSLIPIIIPPLLLFLSPISGTYTILFYAIDLAKTMGLDQPSAVVIAVGLTRTAGQVFGVVFVHRYGRRKSLIISAGLNTILILSMFFLLNEKSENSPLPEWILNYGKVILLVLVMFSYSLGMAPVPWILCGEWPTLEQKGLLSTLGTSLFYLSAFLSSQIPGVLKPCIGLSGMFLVFAAISLSVLIIVLLFVPDTRGLNYQQFKKEICEGSDR